ncbi:MAG: LptF/LptG family permease [candidate division KSB1 bacterium]|nr:LptF/LptG family permease [candidate division KSB1 bacterium]MDZ7365958.1 LptF/LptG family permease [candidate division KSB1 bacterium]MDZ7404074.1 LptF/LptG family permease [candidate division KSB1 bacterium]
MILDRYVSRKFLFNLLFSLTAFASIFITVDLLEKLSEFIDRKAPVFVVASYYFYYLPYVIILSMPVAMLLASMFSVGQLSKYNELTAMLSAGRSLHRILLPLFVIGVLISGAMLVFAERVMPVANQRKAEIKQQYIDRIPRNLPARLSNLYFQESADPPAEHRDGSRGNFGEVAVRRIFIGYYDETAKVAQKVSIQNYNGIFITERIDAVQMRWRESSNRQIGVWEMLQGYRRKFDGEREAFARFDTLTMPELSFTPQVLTKVQKDPEEMSYGELQEFIREVARNGGNPERWLVDLYLKISFPLANFIIVLFGAPLAAGRIRSGGAVGVATSLVICFLYFGTVKTSQSMGQNGTLDPLLAAWLGNIIFLAAGLVVLVKARK